MSEFLPNEEIKWTFRHSAGTTGILGSAFTKDLFKDGIRNNSLSVVVNEVSAGFYNVIFTPDTAGLWVCDVAETAALNTRYANTYKVRTAELRDQTPEEVRRVTQKVEAALSELKNLAQRIAAVATSVSTFSQRIETTISEIRKRNANTSIR